MLHKLLHKTPYKTHYKIGDCLDLMKELSTESINLVLTDIPFNVSINYGNTTNDSMTPEEYSNWIYDRLIEINRVTKTGRPIIIFSSDKNIFPVFSAINKIETLTYNHFIKWNKPNSQGSLPGSNIFNRTELAFLLSKGKFDMSILNRKELYSDTLKYNVTSKKGNDDINPVDHPARRPVALYNQIIEGFTREGDIVLDPFLGSGTTLLSCKLSGRIGIGFEINPEYEELIKKRISNVTKIHKMKQTTIT